MARTHLRPRLIFGRSVDFLIQQHIEVPSARVLTDLIRKGLQERKSELKVFLFQAVTSTIKSGDLNLAHSYKYRPLDAYLIEKARWQREKMHLLARAGLTEFADPGPVLSMLKSALFAQYQTTNENVVRNSHLKIRKDGSFHIATPAADLREDDPLGELFPQRAAASWPLSSSRKTPRPTSSDD